MFDKIRNYFRKRKRKKHFERCRIIYLETQVRECPHLWESILSGEEYCIFNREIPCVLCNPYRCTYMLKKLAEFDKEWKKSEK